MTKDLQATAATPLILSILKQGDSYGYAIIQRVHKISDGELEWADGMLYPILHRLEKKGMVESYWGKSEAGRKRKYYRLKKTGLEVLAEHREKLANILGMINKLEGEVVYV